MQLNFNPGAIDGFDFSPIKDGENDMLGGGGEAQGDLVFKPAETMPVVDVNHEVEKLVQD